MVVAAESWDAIAAYYREDKTMRPMVEFVTYVQQSEFKHRLYGAVYFESLVLCGYSAFNLFSQTLHVSYMSDKRKFAISWYGNEKMEWEITVEEKSMIKQFPELMSKLVWY